MRPLPHRRRRSAAPLGAAALLAVGALACADGPLGGPGLPAGSVSLRLEPRVEPRASVVAAGVTRVRIGITRVPDGLVVLDSVVDLVGAAGAQLDLAVPLASSSDRFAVRLAAADAAGDTIFRATDTTAIARGPVAPRLELLLRYAGPDTGMARIVAGPDTAIVDAGGTVPLWAVGYRAGAPGATPLAHVSWRSADESVVRVSRTGGHATAIAPGRATWVYATTPTGLADSARVVVRHVLTALEASPTSLALTTGAAAPVAVVGRAGDGSALAVEALAWTSSDPAVAVVGADGTVTAVGVGSATITAASGAAQVTVPVAVQPPAVTAVSVAPGAVSLLRTARAQFVATVTLSTGAVATDRAVTWTTSDASVATVDADGVASAVGVGGATITATAGGRSASSTVTVAALPADAIVASPATVQIVAGESLTLGATVTDAAGDALPDPPVSWSSANPVVATVSATGRLTALAPGTTTVTAASSGRTSTVAVTVAPVPVASVQLSSGKLPLVVGEAFRFAATPLAADGTALTGRAVTWSSSAPSVASVDATGQVVSLALGRTFVTATIEGVSSTVKVDVVPVPVSRVQLSASSLSLLLGGTFQLRADAYDSLGRLLPGRAVSWSSTDPSVAGVAIDGLVTGKKTGLAMVTATIEGQSASVTATITAPIAVPAVEFTLAGAQYAYGQTTTAQTVGIPLLTGSATIQLSSANTGIASVQPEVAVVGGTPAPFTVTGRALGTVRLQGTSAGITTGVSDVTVVPATLRAIGWAGTIVRSTEYLRIRFEAGGVDGTATDAVFAEATPITLRFSSDTIEVYRDGFPDQPVGLVSSSVKDGQLAPGATIQPTVGARHFTLIIKGKRGPGWLSLSAAGFYAPLDLRDLTITQ